MKLLFKGSEWTEELINKSWKCIDNIAKKEYGLTYNEPQIEIITSSQMIGNYVNIGMPAYYNHWSFGKRFIEEKANYEAGNSGLAYEMVVNTDPCVCYIMENNSMLMQLLVLAHASVGHASFFKNNYLFKENNVLYNVIDYMNYASKFIAECEKTYGNERVESLLDALHTLHTNGVDKYKRKRRTVKEKEELYKMLLDVLDPDSVSAIFNCESFKDTIKNSIYKYNTPEENILYFAEKNSAVLQDWEKEIVRIVRMISQYFYPQIPTKVMNEGWASFWHKEIVTNIYDKGGITEGHYLEFIKNHCSVINQLEFGDKGYHGINPYALGLNIFEDIRRMCTNPDKEDIELFPDIVNTNWLDTLKYVAYNYRDESFVRQFLSPKVVKKMGLFSLHYNKQEEENTFLVTGADFREDFLILRKTLADYYLHENRVPQLEIGYYAIYPEVSLCIWYSFHKNRGLLPSNDLFSSLERLFGDDRVALETRPGEAYE